MESLLNMGQDYILNSVWLLLSEYLVFPDCQDNISYRGLENDL